MYYENYLFPETDIDKESIKCGVCGKNHMVKNCKLLGNVYPIQDTPTIPQSQLSLPQGLEVRRLADDTTTVITMKRLNRGVQFGPFKAKRSHVMPPSVVFPLKVFLNGRDSMYLETDDEEFCNWMCLVAPATTVENLNMYCYQEKEDIYFSVIKDIEKGSELKVWYAPYYATKMCTQSLVNVQAELDEIPLVKEAQSVFNSNEIPLVKEPQSVFNSFTDDIVGNPIYQMVILHHPQSKKKKKKKKLTGAPLAEVSQNKINKPPATLLGAKEEQEEWTCSVCSAKENDVALFAQHVMTHYQPKKAVSLVCDICGTTCKSVREKQVHKQHCKKPDDTNKSQNCKKDGDASVNSRQQQEQQQQSDRIKNNSELPNEVSSKSRPEDIFVLCEKDNTFERINFERLPNLLSDKNDLSEIVLSEKSTWSKNLINEVDCDVTINVPLDTVNQKDRNLDQINPTILDLSDEIEFHNIKSFSDTIGVDNNLDKSFSINRTVGCLDLFDGVGVQNLLNPADTCVDNMGINNATALQIKNSECNSSKLLLKKDGLNSGFIVFDSAGEQFSSFLLDKPETQKFETSMEVTDEDKNRIVENLLTETHHKLNMSVYDVNSDGDLMKDDGNCHETVGKDSVINDCRTSDTQNTNKSPKKLSTEKKYTCDICKKCFVQPEYLYRHLRKHTGEFSCHYCMTVFARKETLYKHICHANSSGTPREKYPCKSCDKVLCSYNQLKKHESKHRREDSSNEKAPQSRKQTKLCEVCGAMYSGTYLLQTHMLMHSGEPFKCNICGKYYYRRDLLQQHMLSHGPPQVACPVCNKLVRTKKSLQVHLKTHSSYKPLACEVCSKRFFQKGNLMKHIKMHYILNCSLCKQSFTSSEELEKHALTHANDKTYPCSECDRVFLKVLVLVVIHLCWQCRQGRCVGCLPGFVGLGSKKKSSKVMHVLPSASDPQEDLLKKHYRRHNTSDFYNCRYCHKAIQYRTRIKKHLAHQHPEMKPEWDSPGALEAMVEKKTPSNDSTITEQPVLVMNNNVVISVTPECSSNETGIKSASSGAVISGFTVDSGHSSNDQLKSTSVVVADTNMISSSAQELTTSLIQETKGRVAENTDMTAVNEQKTVFVEEGMILEQLRMGGDIFLYFLEPNDENIQSQLLNK